MIYTKASYLEREREKSLKGESEYEWRFRAVFLYLLPGKFTRMELLL